MAGRDSLPETRVRVTNLTKRYGDLAALSDVSFSICQGEVLGLIGPNGSGTTTLFECLAGVANPDLVPENNPVLKPPVSGRIGLWAETDSTSYFKDYVVSQK